MSDGLLTTSVGSLPKPPALMKLRTQVAAGKISREELEAAEKKATEEMIRAQEEIGVDILVDGEMYRGDMATYFAENWDGFTISGLVRSYGNRYYRKPIVVGPVGRPNPVTVEWFRYAQSLTSKPVKGMLTGPYTMMDWSFDEHYGSREKLALAIAELVRDEVRDLERAGAKYIQIDEPAISTRPEELPIALKAMEIVTDGLSSETITISHLCYGDFRPIYPQILDLAVDMLDMELANRHFDILEEFKKHTFTKKIGYGVLDSHSHVVETPEQVREGLLKGLEVLEPEQMYPDPDCGLKTRTLEESWGKLRSLVEAVRDVKATCGIV
jgi:5-methyltetrahydropteroyltriglutamate--homocysteine methyltransferase